MEPNMPPAQTQQPAFQPVNQFKKSSNNKMLIYVIIAVISAAISAAIVWFIMNQQNTNDKKELTSQITTKDNSISELQKTITDLAVAPVNATTTTTTPDNTVSTTTTATDDINTLKSFCANDASKILGDVFYASVANGIYGGCSVGLVGGVGGYWEVTKKVNNVWTEVNSGHAADKAFLEANSIPINVVISPNAYDLLP